MSAPIEDPLLPVIRAALDQTRSAACITTADLDHPGPKIIYVNAAYCAMTGRDEHEVIGETPRIMQGPLTSRQVLDRLKADLEAGQPFIGEAINYRKDGQPYLNSWRIDPVVDGAGETTHYIATQGDITELRRAQRLLAAERAIDRSLGMLLSTPADAETNLTRLTGHILASIDGLIDYGQPAVFGSVRLGTSVATFGAGPDPDAAIIAELAAGGATSTGSRTAEVTPARTGSAPR